MTAAEARSNAGRLRSAGPRCLTGKGTLRRAFSIGGVATVLVAACLQAVAQAPSNDNFVDRIPFDELETSISADDTFATNELGEPKIRGTPAVRSLWWRWTAPPLGGYAVVSTTNSPSHTRVDVFDFHKDFSSLSEVTMQSASGLATVLDRFEFIAANGLDYNIAVDGRDGDKGAIQLDLKVYTTPEILVQPMGTNVTAGQRASIFVGALGKLPLTYQWQFSTLSPNTGFTDLPGAVNSTCAIGKDGVVRKLDEGWYRVIVGNEYGTVTSSVVFVEVNECATPVSLLPTVVVTNVGKTVSFAASAWGTQPFFYQWQFAGQGHSDFVDLPGETSSTLVLNNVSTDQAGQYRFMVSNVACTNQPSTNVASLTVTTNNALVLDPSLPADLTLITNQNANFYVRVSEGYQPIRYQWWFKPDAGVSRILNDESATNLFLSDVKLSQAGLYWATVSNRYALLSSRQARLTVELRPPNDAFANRIPFFSQWTNLPQDVVSSTNVSGGNKNGTAEPGEPSHQGYGPTNSIWWSFTAPVTGVVVVELTSSGAPQVLAAYTGDAVDRLVPVLNHSTNSPLTRFEFLGTNNVEYLFAVDNANGAYSTNVNLKLTFNPNYGAPTITGQPVDFGWDFAILGDLAGSGGCRTANNFVVVATSLDGVVLYQWQFGSSTNGPWADLAGQTNGMLVLPNVTTANQGWYRAAVRNTGTQVAYSAPVHLTVDIGPEIPDSGQPQSLKTNACGSAKFFIHAASCSPMTYQWRHAGTNTVAPNAQGVTTDTLLITDLSPADAGNYDVIVANANLSITSKVATLTLTNYAVLTAQPQPLAKRGCDTATFSVAASASCPLTFQWFFTNQVSTNLLPNATTNSLVLPSLDPANAGGYYVVVSTPFASVTSQVAQLTVQISPVITKSPTGQSVRACDIVNLEVQAQAEPSCSWLAYQWRRYGTNILDQTNRTYSFGAQAETAGDYRVLVSNRWTSTPSAVATVTVDAHPYITAQPDAYQRVRAGDSLTNKVTVSTCGHLDYAWQFKPLNATNFNDVALDFRHVQDTNTGWLVIQNTQTNESGYYRVVVSNVLTNTTSSTSLVRVVRPPPNDYFTNAISLGSAVQASATGYNELATAEPGEPDHGLQKASHSVWWSWTNPFPSLVTVDLDGSDIDTLLGVYTGTTVTNLTTVTEDDDGGTNGRSRVSFMVAGGKTLYFAVDGKKGAEGTNLILSVAAIQIISPPVITQQPLSMAATAGETVKFTNVAYGSPDINIQWFGKGGPVPAVTQIVGYTNYSSILTLSNVTTNDDGVYYAVLSNPYGTNVTTKVTLTFGSIVRGMVSDATKTATNGAAIGIPGVLVSVGDVSSLTDAEGNYELVGVKIGDLRADFMANKTELDLNEQAQFWNRSTLAAAILTATRTNYYDYADNQFEVGKGQTVAKRFSMSPVFTGLRFVLNWTNNPADLDLLLHLPPSDPVSYPWIDYLQKDRGSSTSPPLAMLDADMTRGWGPETITIYGFYPGTYRLYARKFSGQGGYFLTQSSAQVVAYLGGDVTSGTSPQIRILGSLDVPTQGTNDWWYVCDIDGLTTNITWINQLLSTDPRGLMPQSGAGLPVVRRSKDGKARQGDIPSGDANYEWDFGDGTNVSTEYEPVHAYADPGWKTVSLKVTEQSGSPPKVSTTTRTNYIYVRNVPPTVVITNPVADAIFRPGDRITLQTAADGIDDPIRQVDYYLVNGAQKTFLGTATNAPYTFVFTNPILATDPASCVDCLSGTNVFVAQARDLHGATTWSDAVSTRSFDLRGDILILRDVRSPEIATMVDYLSALWIREQDSAGTTVKRSLIVKVLDQQGLYFDLVRGFKVVIWDDQGRTSPGLTDDTVGVLQQAFDAGIPLYLIGDQLGESRDLLTDEERFAQWTGLVGLQKRGSIPGPQNIRGIKLTYEDGLFYGWNPDAEASTTLPHAGALERLELTTTNMDVVADVTVAGLVTNSPIMLRYPRLGQPDFGGPRRLVQDFRVTSDLDPQPPADAASQEDRRILFLNGTAWLLRMFECQLLNVQLGCLAPPPLVGATPGPNGEIPSGRVGEPMTDSVMVTQNGECDAAGVLVTNQVSPRLQVVSAEIVGAASPDSYEIVTNSNLVVVGFASLPPRANYEFRTVVVPRHGGWVTNTYTVTRGLYAGVPCVQTAFIEGPTCAGPFRLTAILDTNKVVNVSVTGAVGCSFQLQSSLDLRNWQDEDTAAIEPDRDPYAVPLPAAADAFRFYRLRQLQ